MQAMHVCVHAWDARAHVLQVPFNISVVGDAGLHRWPFQFRWYEQVSVSSLNPSYGPGSGGTKVTVIGNLFKPVTGLACRFRKSEKVLAEYMSATMMRCVSPVYSEAMWRADETVNVQVSINNQQFSTEFVTFELYGIIEWRPWGAAYHGRSLISILSPNMVGSSQYSFRCRFGLSKVDAFFNEDTGRIQCFTPLSPEFLVSLQISFGFDEWTSENKPFQYYRLAPYWVFPNAAPANSGTDLFVAATAHGGFGAENYMDYGSIIFRFAVPHHQSPFVRLSVCPFVHPPIRPPHPSACSYVHPSICPPVCSPIHLAVRLSVQPSMHKLSTHTYTCLGACICTQAGRHVCVQDTCMHACNAHIHSFAHSFMHACLCVCTHNTTSVEPTKHFCPWSNKTLLFARVTCHTHM